MKNPCCKGLLVSVREHLAWVADRISPDSKGPVALRNVAATLGVAMDWDGDVVEGLSRAAEGVASVKQARPTHLYVGGSGATRPYPFCGAVESDALCQHVAIHETVDPKMREVVERNQSQADCPACLRISSVYELTFKKNAEWKQ